MREHKDAIISIYSPPRVRRNAAGKQFAKEPLDYPGYNIVVDSRAHIAFIYSLFVSFILIRTFFSPSNI